jgi:GTP cyclohydrolase IA
MNTELMNRKTAETFTGKPSRKEAEKAVATLLMWAGDDPAREGLKDTPKRVVDAYLEMFSGYAYDPKVILGKTFANVDNYNEIVLLKDIAFESCCEHHILPIIGVAHIAYVSKDRLVGLSKLARLIDVFAKRLQTQEGMTSQIIRALEEVLSPVGAMVIIEAQHSCMSIRGVHKSSAITVTEKFTGCFVEGAMQDRVYKLISNKKSF